jgi:hypothetical protein
MYFIDLSKGPLSSFTFIETGAASMMSTLGREARS